MAARNRATQAAELLLEKNPSKMGPPVNVRELARSHAMIFRDNLPDDVSGLLIPPSPESSARWMIVVNKRHSPERQRFTLAHELGHLLLHEYTKPHADGRNVVRYRNAVSALGTDREEIEANQFAAELLMPASRLIPRLESIGLISWSDETVTPDISCVLTDLAYDFGVSQQALLLRIGNLLQA